MSKGKVYIVGAGPGDPGLLTLRAQQVLSKAEVVLYDALIHPRILGFIPKTALKIFRGHRSKKGALTQARINALLVQLAKKGKRVVRLKGGDPFVFGRGAEEALELEKNDIAFEIVPGVTSAIAVPAYAGISVTHRTMNPYFTVVTGHEDPSKPDSQLDWTYLAQDQGTLVFLMGLHSLPELCRRLMEEGRGSNTPAAAIQWGTTGRQKTVLGNLHTLPELTRKARLTPPTTVVVGKVVSLAPQLDWVSKKPLWGLKVLVTRTPAKASHLSSLLEEEGAEVVEVPTIELRPVRLSSSDIKRVESSASCDWIIFTSGYAVEIFMENLVRSGLKPLSLRRAKLACVGESTARTLAAYGLRADLVPKDYKQEGLVKAFGKMRLNGKKVLFARAKEGRDLLVKFLRNKKTRLYLLPLYENRVPAESRGQLGRLFKQEGGVDLVVFASSSAVDHFYSLLPGGLRKKVAKSLPTAVIGPITATSVRKWGGKVMVQPKQYTLEKLVQAIGRWHKKLKP